LGIRSTQIAEATEKAYYDNLLQGQYTIGLDRFRKRVTNLKTDLFRARMHNNIKEATEYQEKLQQEIEDLRNYIQANAIPYFPWASFNATTTDKARENATGIVMLKSINKAARADVQEKNRMYAEGEE
jgi:hypothetical protein